MNFLYASDLGYVNLSKISIASLLEANKGEQVKIYYVEDHIGDENKKWLEDLVSRFHAEIYFINASEIDTSFIQKTPYSTAGYYRLLVSNIIPEDKIIYLDCDTIVLGSFRELWNLDISEYLVGGVKDTVQNYVATSVGMRNNSLYINAGMMYMNLDKWRKEGVDQQIREAFAHYNGKVPHHDQGIINCVANDRILYLPVKYNLMSQYLYFKPQQLRKLFQLDEFYSDQDIAIGKEQPVVVHFLNKFYGRPWNTGSQHPYTGAFDTYIVRYGINLKKNDQPIHRGIAVRKYICEHFPFGLYLLFEFLLDVKRRIAFRREYGV